MDNHFREPENIVMKQAATRRTILKGILTAGAVSTPAVAFSAPNSPAFADGAPTYEELTRYYAFLFGELQRLSKEIGVDMCCNHTAHRNGDSAALNNHLLAPPSARAKLVMKAIGADCETLVSHSVAPAQSVNVCDPKKLVEYHADRLCEAMNGFNPEQRYVTRYDDKYRFVLTIGVPVGGM